MHDLIKHFVRDHAGIWTCIEPTEIRGRQVGLGARFPHGEKFMGVEVARLLDRLYEDDQARGSHKDPH